MSERLVLETRGRPPAELPRAGVLVIGSDPKRAGLVLEGAAVAGAHCAIGRTKGGGWAVKDLGSASGTFVNGARVESARLAAGDELEVGDASLRVVDPARAGDPRPSSPRAPRADETQEIDPRQLVRASEPAPEPPRAENARAETSRAEPAVSGYRIERRIGRGGMGDVYLATQTSLERRVALKVLGTRFASDAEFVRRFQAEARAAAALNHPNVVTVYDVGSDKGVHYLSMEYMERGTLEDRLQKSGRLPVDEVLAILRDAAAGLVYAEARGIVHRDLKPANLMQNHVGQTKIADLGLATHVEAEESQSADKKVFGTPHFMSPEQARGERVDHRSDLYSLGATAYRLLSGHTPYEGQDSREIVRALLNAPPRPLKELAPDLDPAVVALVERLMQKDVGARMPTAQEALREIDRIRAGAGSSSGASRASSGSRGGLVVVLLLVAAGGGGWWWWHEHEKTAAPKPHPLASADPGAQHDAPADTPKETPREKPTHEKDDKELQLFEAQAKVALLELQSREMKPTEKRDELRLLAARFQGTNAAASALEKADQISKELDASSAAEGARKVVIDEIIGKIRAAASLDRQPPDPGKSFLAMRAVPGQPELAGDAAFVAARKEVENAVVSVAALYAKGQMADVSVLLDRGDFEGARARLEALLPVFDLPDFPLGSAPAGVSELFEIGRTARERYHNLSAMKAVFERRQTQEDLLAVATAFGGPTGLEREIATLDLVAAHDRLEKLAGKVASAELQAFAHDLANDLVGARAAIDSLAREFTSWKRKGFSDPRDKKGTARTAVGADQAGISYEADGGKVERVPWSAFGGDPKELAKLFHERLGREWKPDELNAIATLFRATACVQAVQIGAKMLDTQKRANFTEANARDVADAFALAAQWADRAGGASRDKVARESAAADALATALRQVTDSQWSSAAANVERLLSEYQDTLLVRLLSDGRRLEDLDAATAAAESK